MPMAKNPSVVVIPLRTIVLSSNIHRPTELENKLDAAKLLSPSQRNAILIESVRLFASGKGYTNYGHERIKPGHPHFFLLSVGLGLCSVVVFISVLFPKLGLDEANDQ